MGLSIVGLPGFGQAQFLIYGCHHIKCAAGGTLVFLCMISPSAERQCAGILIHRRARISIQIACPHNVLLLRVAGPRPAAFESACVGPCLFPYYDFFAFLKTLRCYPKFWNQCKILVLRKTTLWRMRKHVAFKWRDADRQHERLAYGVGPGGGDVDRHNRVQPSVCWCRPHSR